MAQLSSPGVSVSVIDESFYTPAAAGTTPLIIVASEENKQNGSGTGIAPGTIKANAGQVYLLTSQKDLADTFGTPIFKTDANNNPIHAGEQNEYGLQTAYSYLGVSNRAFVVRADLDVKQLDASADAPAGLPANGTYWFDTASTSYGIFEWNSSDASVTNGQSFVAKTPIVITDPTRVDAGAPKAGVGTIGDYAIVATSTLNKLFFKKNKTNSAAGTWVQVGSNDWAKSWPAVAGTKANPTITAAGVGEHMLILNGVNIDTGTLTVNGLVTAIGANVTGVTAANINGKLELYLNGDVDSLIIGGTLTGVSADQSAIGIKLGTYRAPKLQISAHTSVPLFKSTDANSRPTGSVWFKTTEPNKGASVRVKRYNESTSAWEEVSCELYENGHSALASLDGAGGGINLASGALYAKFNDGELTGADVEANFKLYRRVSAGETKIVSSIVTSATFAAGSQNFLLRESIKGETILSDAVTITFTATGAAGDADIVASAINIASTTYTKNAVQTSFISSVVASVDSANRIVIQHMQGGEIYIEDSHTNAPFRDAGFSTTTPNLYADPAGGTGKFVATLWKTLSYTSGADAPTSLTADGQLWYNSIIDEVDMLVHDGSKWVGYLNYTQNAGGGTTTDPAGPIVSATAPLTQSDATALANGDLWIDTSDLENFPMVYKFNYATQKWVLVDSSDQSTENGILFHDARWNTTGLTATASSIADLLDSNFVDFDAPDPALYPKGMLLWNLRRSGFNVKRFVRDYVDVTARNHRSSNDELMTSYYPHRWLSEAGNQENGAGTFGRKAQRKVVIQKLQALVNANQQIRDEEARIFNLIACPGYPELIGEMISLNYDRGLTAFIVGDTPPRLTPDATSLLNWGTNQAGALEDNDTGLVSSDEYMAVFYPWGYTSDNIGNNVVVPPSHMMLRTIALNDQVAYPWFAPAGTRRGGITNATAVGYITSEGEFQSVALNTGQRDTLAQVKVNPLTFITGTGLVNYGQYTRARNASSLDRINVARLVIYLRRQFTQLAKPYVFEPNDKITRDELKGAAESLLLELVGQRALYDYIVVCDTSNNTPARIDRSELYLDVAIEPVKAVEFIYIPLRLKNTGEIAGL
jgi:hypothetical protein